MRSHFDYRSVNYDIAINESFQNRLESFQCNAILAIKGATNGS